MHFASSTCMTVNAVLLSLIHVRTRPLPHNRHVYPQLHDAYAGEKSLRMFRGDHNSNRPASFYTDAVAFLKRALMVDPSYCSCCMACIDFFAHSSELRLTALVTLVGDCGARACVFYMSDRLC